MVCWYNVEHAVSTCKGALSFLHQARHSVLAGSLGGRTDVYQSSPVEQQTCPLVLHWRGRGQLARRWCSSLPPQLWPWGGKGYITMILGREIGSQ